MANYYGNLFNNNIPGGKYSDDKLYGYGGNDKLYGYGGNDKLYGHSGRDILYGGSGNDELHGHSGRDILYGGLDSDWLYGGSDNDDLYGESGNDLLDGGSGIDKMFGGEGDDSYYVDNGDDEIVEYRNEGTDIVVASTSYSLYRSPNVENLILTDSASYGIGNSSNNLIAGNDLNNTLDGKAGGDRLVGLGGNDVYRVDSYQDEVVEYSDQGDRDRVESWVSYSLPINVENLHLKGNAISGTGNNDSNKIYGNNSDNSITGTRSFYNSDEIDYLTGSHGRDRFYLGNQYGSFYQSSILNNSNPDDDSQDIRGERQYAMIIDFYSSYGDRIYLEGSAEDYEIGSYRDYTNRGIYLDTNNDNLIDNRDDLIGVVFGSGEQLNLSNTSQFAYL